MQVQFVHFISYVISELLSARCTSVALSKLASLTVTIGEGLRYFRTAIIQTVPVTRLL